MSILDVKASEGHMISTSNCESCGPGFRFFLKVEISLDCKALYCLAFLAL